MAYLDNTASRADPRAIATVVAIHGAIGALLISGLTVTGVIAPPPPRFEARPVYVPLPPPPAPKEMQPDPKVPPRSEVFVPKPAKPLTAPASPALPPSEPMTGSGSIVVSSGGASPGMTNEFPVVLPTPTASPMVQPTRPIPRGEPGSWITPQDYRSRWISEGLTGTARFRLSISPQGRVTNCEITRSTGHQALDDATCTLVQRRASFTPSRDGAGNPVAGTYENAVVWRLPD
ncbi:energy transducer TonB [Porphyrobacter sp. GA68]|uniref:energy transducer TonB n=1 Tax=Porphyrobacter sp. GA68 TaxID=2883480 RepID=UPI001D182D0D|nr:energy transducer TonB [Porphyrobacter sp. GA68]